MNPVILILFQYHTISYIYFYHIIYFKIIHHDYSVLIDSKINIDEYLYAHTYYIYAISIRVGYRIPVVDFLLISFIK